MLEEVDDLLVDVSLSSCIFAIYVHTPKIIEITPYFSDMHD